MDADELVGSPSSEVPTREPTGEACMGKRVDKQSGEFKGYCQAWPGRGTDHVGEGRCKNHGGNNSGVEGNDGGAPENNGNAETHGLTSDAEKWFERHKEEVADSVKEQVETWVDAAPFGWAATGNVKLLTRCAVNEARMEQAESYVDTHGVIVENVVGTTEDGRPITRDEENPALLPKSRMLKDTIRTLKELNVLEPDRYEVEHSGGVSGEFSVDITHHRRAADDTE